MNELPVTTISDYLNQIQFLFDSFPAVNSVELILNDGDYDSGATHQLSLKSLNNANVNLYESPVEHYENSELITLLMELNIKYTDLSAIRNKLDVTNFDLFWFLYPHLTRVIRDHYLYELIEINREFLQKLKLLAINMDSKTKISVKFKLP